MVAYLLRPDELLAPTCQAEALAFLRSGAAQSSSALAACAALITGGAAGANRRDAEHGSAALSAQDHAGTIP